MLDPEQNSTFRDHYLGVPFDLSKVLFIATANLLDTIPAPLRDRMEVIELPGYTEEEKVEIARRYLVPRQLEANGLSRSRSRSPTRRCAQIVARLHARGGRAQPRARDRRDLRKVAVRVAEGKAGQRCGSTRPTCRRSSARRSFETKSRCAPACPASRPGLAWTPVGGDILFIEATRMPGNGKLILTGQLGDVMKESAQAALSLRQVAGRARSASTRRASRRCDIHVHVPAGAIPKDGPSAGVTMVTALVSLLTGRTVRNDVAMTGEITLRGRVLPVGGIKEKVLAAHRARHRTRDAARAQPADLEDVPESARKDLQFVWLERVEDALARRHRRTGAESRLICPPSPACGRGRA